MKKWKMRIETYGGVFCFRYTWGKKRFPHTLGNKYKWE